MTNIQIKHFKCVCHQYLIRSRLIVNAVGQDYFKRLVSIILDLLYDCLKWWWTIVGYSENINTHAHTSGLCKVCFRLFSSLGWLDFWHNWKTNYTRKLIANLSSVMFFVTCFKDEGFSTLKKVCLIVKNLRRFINSTSEKHWVKNN